MKVIIEGYEVEIKAKFMTSNRYNKKDTMSVLNTLAMYASDSIERCSDLGYPALERTARKTRDNIMDTLDALGYYNHKK